jgi:hypothetical protein
VAPLVTVFTGPARWVLLAASLASIAGGLVALFGWSGLVGLSGALGVALYTGWTSDAESRAAHRRLSAAFRRGQKPLPRDAEEADGVARAQLARPAADRWGQPAVLVALAVACVAMAAVRGDPAAGLPALPLVFCAAMSVLLARRVDLRAGRWLAGRTAHGDTADR